MKCLMRYGWVKLPRCRLPEGKGILGAWARLAARAAYRRGVASYCGYSNEVTPGMWSGGVTGLKSILHAKSRAEALQTLDTLARLGYLTYELDPKTKKLTYQIRDWVVHCTAEACMGKAVYATDGYGFLCVPRGVAGRLAAQRYRFEEADAWLDLWCHTAFEDPRDPFSFLAPVVRVGTAAALTLETLGRRWGWEKIKVWRFFKKHQDTFALCRLPGSMGCLVFNKLYPAGIEISLPGRGEIVRILAQMRICRGYAHKMPETGKAKTAPARPAMPLAGRRRLRLPAKKQNLPRAAETPAVPDAAPGVGKPPASLFRKGRVALLPPAIRIRAYLSLCRNWKKGKKDCTEDKQRRRVRAAVPGRKNAKTKISAMFAALHQAADLTQIAKECFSW